MRGLGTVVGMTLLLGPAALAADVDPAKLVGTWEVTKGTQPPAGSTLELTKDGKFAATVKGQPISFAGVYRLSGDQLTLDPPGRAMTVVELTEDAMKVGGPTSTMEYRRIPAASKPGLALEGWGKLIDTAGDVRVRPEGRSLVLELPGTPHLLAPEREIMNAPRTSLPASGRFHMSVRVSGPFAPRRESSVPGLTSRHAGGLVVWKDARNYLVFQHRASIEAGDQIRHQVVLEELVDGHKGVTLRQPTADGPLYLNLDRKQGQFLASFSSTGRSPRELKLVDTTWADGELEVGVIAVSTSAAPHPVTFDDFTLKTR